MPSSGRGEELVTGGTRGEDSHQLRAQFLVTGDFAVDERGPLRFGNALELAEELAQPAPLFAIHRRIVMEGERSVLQMSVTASPAAGRSCRGGMSLMPSEARADGAAASAVEPGLVVVPGKPAGDEVDEKDEEREHRFLLKSKLREDRSDERPPLLAPKSAEGCNRPGWLRG